MILRSEILPQINTDQHSERQEREEICVDPYSSVEKTFISGSYFDFLAAFFADFTMMIRIAGFLPAAFFAGFPADFAAGFLAALTAGFLAAFFATGLADFAGAFLAAVFSAFAAGFLAVFLVDFLVEIFGT
jgi:hypothetical protein